MTSTDHCKIRSRQTDRMWPAECRIPPPCPVQRTLTRPLPWMDGCGLQRDRLRMRPGRVCRSTPRAARTASTTTVSASGRPAGSDSWRQMPPESELCAAGSCGHRVSVRVHLSPSCPSPTKDTAGHARYGHNVEQYRKEAVRHRPYNRGRGARRDSVQGARGDRKEGSGPAPGSLHVGQQGPWLQACRRHGIPDPRVRSPFGFQE